MNFNKDLLAMSQEVHYWERLRMPIPYIAMEINAQREKYRVLRDNILMVRPRATASCHLLLLCRRCCVRAACMAGHRTPAPPC